MSVNICVGRGSSSGVLIGKWGERITTPPFTYWKYVHYGQYYYYIRLGSYTYIYVASAHSGATYNFPVGDGFTAYNENNNFENIKFTIETGYKSVANKNIPSSDISVSIRNGTSTASALEPFYLPGEVAYYHTSAVDGGKYRFLEWRNGEIPINSDNPLERTMYADLTLTAIYEQYKWTLAALPNNSTVGEAYIGVSGTATSGVYENGAFETIRAVVKPEYAITHKFKRWTLGGTEISTEPALQITTEDFDKTYVAVFIPINYTLNVTSQNESQGSVETYLAGVKQVTNTGLSVEGLSSVEVRATSAFGFYFVGWHNGTSIVSSTASFPFSMTEANLSLQARFAILPDADLVVTKKKGSGAEDPEDMGSVTLYHSVSTFVVASAAGELTLNASVFTTKQYRLVPTPASALFQFDGWYQTVDGSDVPIADDTMFNVDGNDLYVMVADETAINVIARFSTRTLCTIDPVVSDASTYTASNDAEDAGCACFVTTLPPDNDVDSDGAHDTGDQWLSGQTITVEARQAAGWELRAWYVIRTSDGVTVASKAKGESGFGQVFTFTLLSGVQVISVSAYTLPPNQVQIQTLLKSGQPLTSGTLEIHPCGENYVELENGATANVAAGGLCEITAIPANGYKFLRWRVAAEDGTIVSAVPVYTFTVAASAVYYAEFEATTETPLVLFESSGVNRTAAWSSKTFIASVPACFSAARIYAGSFPVLLRIGASENPVTPSIASKVMGVVCTSQDAFRLASRRKEKYFIFSIQASTPVFEVVISTSMEGLKNG